MGRPARASCAGPSSTRQDGTDTRSTTSLISGAGSSSRPRSSVMTTGALTYEQRLWLGILHAGTQISADSCHRLHRGRPQTLADLNHPCHLREESDHPTAAWLHLSRDQATVRAVGDPRQQSTPARSSRCAALLRAERERYVKVGIGVLAAVVQQGLSTAERLFDASLEIRKLRHGETIRLALARHFRWGAVVRRARCGPDLPRSTAWSRRTRQVLRRDRDGRMQVPGLRVGPRGRHDRRYSRSTAAFTSRSSTGGRT